MYAPWEPVIMMYTYTLYIIIYMYLKDTDTWGVPLPCRFFSRLRACSPAFYMGLLIEDRRSVHLYEVLDIKWEAIWTPKRLKKKRSCAKFIKFITSIYQANVFNRWIKPWILKGELISFSRSGAPVPAMVAWRLVVLANAVCVEGEVLRTIGVAWLFLRYAAWAVW